MTAKESYYETATSNPATSPFPTADFVFKVSTPTDTSYDYETINGNNISIIGEISQPIGKITYTTPEIIAVNPLTYGDHFTDTFYYTFNSSGITNYCEAIDSFDADGYGTLIIPSGTYHNVLRITEKTDITDSTPSGTKVTVGIFSNYWYNDAHPGYLLKIDRVRHASSSSYTLYDVSYYESTTGVKNVANNSNHYTGYFNNNSLIIHGNFKQNKQSQVFVFNMTG